MDLKINYIDPGHFTDSSGNRYLYFNNGGYVPLSEDGFSVTGDFKQAYNGWKIPRDRSIECFCMEGPKVVKHGDYYYLTVAKGGTAGPATSHILISAHSRSPLGPWENAPFNPIIRTKQSTEKWWSKGHGTLFEALNGSWWMVFHGYEKGYYNMGRQTLLEPVEWTKDGWLADKEKILANLRGWQFPTEKSVVINRHVFLRIKKIENTVDMYYSLDGQKWIKIENSLEVSGFNHNVLSGFLSLRLGLTAVGNGSVTYRNFIYSPI